jgi:rhodanese-related sulfurtransferase
VSEGGRALRQALALAALSVLAAAAVHFPLVQRFFRGEFRQTFFAAAEHPGVRLITLAEGEEIWHAGGAVFLDARSAAAYQEGHVPGARSLPASTAAADFSRDVRGLPREGIAVVYCEGGDCQSSLHLAERLEAEDFKDVRVMTGGWDEWVKAGLPAETGPPREGTDGRE